jgi:hypothetical protein
MSELSFAINHFSTHRAIDESTRAQILRRQSIERYNILPGELHKWSSWHILSAELMIDPDLGSL